MEETTASKRQQLPTLPFELIEEEILCKLPVKFLIQLRCICTSWNSLISDPNFAKKHFRLSKKRHHLIVSSTNNLNELVLLDSPISSAFSPSIVKQKQLSYPITGTNDIYSCRSYLSSCDGILCFTISDNSAALWNPSIRKFKILPPLENPVKRVSFSFGYDNFIDNYKIIGVSLSDNQGTVRVLTLSDPNWRRIQDFPCGDDIFRPGIFVSGTVNWLVYGPSSSSSVTLVSLNLEKESYQKLPQPDLVNGSRFLGMLRDCLCIFANRKEFLDVWIMKEYGNKESWTKFHTVPNMIDQGLGVYIKALYVSEDGKMLLDFCEYASGKLKLVGYDSKNGTFNIPKIQNINKWVAPEVYVESLISPNS